MLVVVIKLLLQEFLFFFETLDFLILIEFLEIVLGIFEILLRIFEFFRVGLVSELPTTFLIHGVDLRIVFVGQSVQSILSVLDLILKVFQFGFVFTAILFITNGINTILQLFVFQIDIVFKIILGTFESVALLFKVIQVGVAFILNEFESVFDFFLLRLVTSLNTCFKEVSCQVIDITKHLDIQFVQFVFQLVNFLDDLSICLNLFIQNTFGFFASVFECVEHFIIHINVLRQVNTSLFLDCVCLLHEFIGVLLNGCNLLPLVIEALHFGACLIDGVAVCFVEFDHIIGIFNHLVEVVGLIGDVLNDLIDLLNVEVFQVEWFCFDEFIKDCFGISIQFDVWCSYFRRIVTV